MTNGHYVTIKDPTTEIPLIVFKKLVERAKLPRYMTAEAAGADLFADQGYILEPGEYKLIGTGLTAEIPAGYEVQIRPRSGLAIKHGITVLNTPGTIDSDYKLEWKIILINHSQKAYIIEPGAAVAQMVVAPVTQLDFAEDGPDGIALQDSVSDAVRAGGMGSTS